MSLSLSGSAWPANSPTDDAPSAYVAPYKSIVCLCSLNSSVYVLFSVLFASYPEPLAFNDLINYPRVSGNVFEPNIVYNYLYIF